jgi:hypothetical protein
MATNRPNAIIPGNMAPSNLGAVANHLQNNMVRQAQLAAQHAQAFQTNMTPSGPPQGGPPRGPFFGNQGGGMAPPMLANNMPGNFFPAFQQALAANAAQEHSNAAVVAAAKLCPTKGNVKANSNLVVRNAIRKFHPNGGLITVAQWTRKCIEENLDWLVKLVRRHHENENQVLLIFGDGCETLVLIDDMSSKVPTDFASIPKLAVGVSLADADYKGSEEKLSLDGVLQPTDCIWEHLKYEQTKTEEEEKQKCLFLHTRVNVWTDGVDARRRVVQVITGKPDEPFQAKNYIHNYPFAKQVLDAWRVSNSATGARGESVTPKAPVMLEKTVGGDEDTKNAPKVIKPAKKAKSPEEDGEESGKKKTPVKKKATKATKKEVESTAAKADPKVNKPETEKEDTKKKTPKKPTPTSKAAKAKEPSEDASDEVDGGETKKPAPKAKAELKTPERQTRRSSAGNGTTPDKAVDPSKKRGRPKGAKNKEKPEGTATAKRAKKEK